MRRIWLVLLSILIVAGALLWRERQISAANRPSLVPVFSQPAGRYDHDIWLSMEAPHPEAEIWFTFDGQTPDSAGATKFVEPVLLSADPSQVIVVRAQAFLPDGTAGAVANASYFMGIDASLPMLSIIVDPDDFWDEEQGIYVNHAQRGREWERPVELTYVTADGETGFQVGAGIRIHGGWTRYFSNKKSLRLHFREAYGARKLEFPMFGEEGQIAFDHLVLHNSLQDLLLFRNKLIDALTEQMGGYSTRSQPVLLFINGQPWGIYYARERINERWLAERYDIPGADISDTPNNRGMQSAEQLAVDTVHWENLMAFVLENDLSNPNNYAYLQTQMDVENFIDYYILQMYAANTDWPHHNVQQFRPRTHGGRWEWTVWDNDFAFDRVDRQMIDHVLNVQHPLGERMVILLNKLLENPDFRNQFITRTADWLNTTLDTASVQENISQIANELEPDIGYEKLRWDIDADWDATVDHMRDFAEQRPGIMRDQFVETLGLSGTATIFFEGSGPEPGWIVVNDSAAQLLPWQGEYFQDSVIQLRAIPPAGFKFERWDGLTDEGATTANPVSMQVTGDSVVVPVFTALEPGEPRPGDATIVAYHANDEGAIEGDWFDIRINREDGLDLRGWRLTDNDTITATDEGSLIFVDDPLLANIAKGEIVRVVATKTPHNSSQFPEDGPQDGVTIFYVGNGRIDDRRDPWFNLGRRDNLVLLAPGPTEDMADDIAIDVWSENGAVTPASFLLPPESGTR